MSESTLHMHVDLHLLTEFVKQQAGGSTIDVFNPFRNSEVRVKSYITAVIIVPCITFPIPDEL